MKPKTVIIRQENRPKNCHYPTRKPPKKLLLSDKKTAQKFVISDKQAMITLQEMAVFNMVQKWPS